MKQSISRAWDLALISFLALFLELIFIRWLPANILSLAYFTNLVLLASFFGLGLGALSLNKGRDTFKWFPPALLFAMAVFIALRYFEVITSPDQSELIWNYFRGNKTGAFPFHIGVLTTLTLTYLLIAGLFVLIGRKIGSLLAGFRPLTAYALNLAGSLLGIAVFTLLSLAVGEVSRPSRWLILAGLIWLWLLRKEKKFFFIGLACAVAIIATIIYYAQYETWSPYYGLTTKKQDDGSVSLFVNRFFHQEAVNFDAHQEIRDKYSLPYTLKPKPAKVLILGAGLGNDVAIAQRNGVADITAVEIDPTIVKLGRELHPNHPYQDPKVKIVVDDARSFLKKTNEKYDMIILGTLDSHTLLSSMSTVRLDNFVYTLESLQDIKNHLKDDGIAVLMFSLMPNHWLGPKILNSVTAVFPNPLPLAYFSDRAWLFNFMMIAGPGLNNILAQPTIKDSGFLQVAEPVKNTTNLQTDDWPYLYLSKHTIPSHYLKAICLFLLLSLIGIFYLVPRKKFGWPGVNFFSLGAAFLLLETKSITTLSLLFGSTWLVNSFVFGGILLMALAANLVAAKINIKRVWPLYLCLGLALLLNYWLPLGYFLGQSFWLKSILPALLTALPLFFGSLIFSWHFKSVHNPAVIYGLNLAGAVLGGFLEYSSMAIGLNKLYLVALIFYIISFLSYLRRDNHSDPADQLS